jgi:hypothetical protein
MLFLYTMSRKSKEGYLIYFEVQKQPNEKVL